LDSKKAPVFQRRLLKCCRGRDRTSTRQLVKVQSSVVDPGRINIAINTALYFIYPVILTPETRGSLPIKNSPKQKAPVFQRRLLKCCRGRDRTSTRQLVKVQSSVVDPGRINIAINTALYFIYPVILTPETRGHVCQKFHHPTIFKIFSAAKQF
jgi:hypothetical protein